MNIDTNECRLKSQFFTQAFYVLIFLFVVRLIAMYFVPLNDSTEARYGEIARKMLETGDWLILQQEYGIPFWAKPPLSTWLSAASMKWFGVSELPARLPALFLSLGVLVLVWNLAKKHSNSIVAMAAVLVLSGSLFFFLDAGTVMTDPALLFCTTLSMTSFWFAFVAQNRIWAYMFFIGLGLGLLAKGPVVLVLVGLPVFFWILLRKEWRNLWNRLPWIQGSIIMAVIAVPWYVLVEQRTPGFLNYFIIGEHFNRFLISGWLGDKYGEAHSSPWGMIWVYAIAGIFPWNLIGCVWLAHYWKKIPAFCKDNDGWMSYLLLWLLMPLVFFTFASNIIYPYVIPTLPAYALIIGEGWNRSMKVLDKYQWILYGSVSTGCVFLLVSSLFVLFPNEVAKSQRPMIDAWKKENPPPGSQLIYWDYGNNYSARFYAAGHVKSATDAPTLCRLLSTKSNRFLVINEKNISEVPYDLYAKAVLIKKVKIINNVMILLRFPELNC